jgi:hypothetical protein
MAGAVGLLCLTLFVSAARFGDPVAAALLAAETLFLGRWTLQSCRRVAELRKARLGR